MTVIHGVFQRPVVHYVASLEEHVDCTYNYKRRTVMIRCHGYRQADNSVRRPYFSEIRWNTKGTN